MATANATVTLTEKEVIGDLKAVIKKLKNNPDKQQALLGKVAELCKEFSAEPTSQAQSAPVKSADATTLPSSHFKYDKAKYNWKLMEDVQFTPPEPTALTITGVAFLRDGESYIGGEEMVRRDRNEFKCNQGQVAAEWLLENQHLIPTDLRKKALVFTGTIWQDPDGDHSVVCLCWYGDRWLLRFDLLDVDWHDDNVLARLSGSTSA